MMTWDEFKAWVEAKGVKDKTRVLLVNVFDAEIDELDVTWNEDAAGEWDGTVSIEDV